MGSTSFTQLDVWKKAHQAALGVYHLTRELPDEERFGLTSQMRKAAVSIPANIAEGFGRRKPHDKARFYNISEGSTEEMKYFLILAKDLGYCGEKAELGLLFEDVSRMLRRLVERTLRDS